MADNTPPPPQHPNPPPQPQPQHTHHQTYTPDTPSHSQYPSPYSLPHPHPQNPNSQLDPLNKTHDPISALAPPGADPTSSSADGVNEVYDPSMLYAQPEYYQDPNVANSLKNWAFQVLRYYGLDCNASGGTIPPVNATFPPHGNSAKKKSAKKTKVVQSVWCEVCTVECNTKEVLDKHKMGKKHQKNEEKLQQSTAPHPPAASGVSTNPVIGPQENPASSSMKKTRKQAAEEVDLETKRRRMMDEGAASDAVRVCTICNVVCNSDVVFAYHNAGKKHASMVMKQSVSGTGVATATLSGVGVATPT